MIQKKEINSSDTDSVFSDGSQSDCGSIFSDGESSCDLNKASNAESIFPTVLSVLIPTEKEIITGNGTKKKVNMVESTGASLNYENSTRTRSATTVAFSNIRRDQENEEPKMAKRKKASTPIRKRISRLEKRASGADIGDTYGNTIRQRKQEQRKISGIYKEVASADMADDENMFEMTMLEDDREEQRKKHRLFREKFENLNKSAI
jgi:hypothetical protein